MNKINEELKTLAYKHFNKTVLNWKEQCPDETVGISDDELCEKGLSLINVTEENFDNESLLCAEFHKEFSNGVKAVYIAKFKGNKVFDDVFYLERM